MVPFNSPVIKWFDRILWILVVAVHAAALVERLLNIGFPRWAVVAIAIIGYGCVWVLFIWSWSRRRVLIWRIGMLVLLVFATVMFSGAIWPTPPTAGPNLLVADLNNLSGDPQIPTVAGRKLLAVGLEESRRLQVYPSGKMADALRRMGRSIRDPVTRSIGRDLCVREGITYLITWELTREERGYLLQADIELPATQVIASHASFGPFKREELTDAVGQLAKKIRRDLGDTLIDVMKQQPLAPATTGSLAALQAYSEAEIAMRDVQYKRAKEKLHTALELDPEFALALVELASIYDQEGDLATAAALATRAHELRGRLTPAEQIRVDDYYYWLVLNDHEEALKRVKEFLQAYPNNRDRYGTLSYETATLMRFDEAEEAEETYLGHRPWSTSVESAITLWQLQLAQGKVSQAMGTVAALEQDVPDLRYLPYMRITTIIAQGRTKEADEQMVSLGNSGNTEASLWLNGFAHVYMGRLDSAVADWQGYLRKISASRDQTPWIESSDRLWLWLARVHMLRGANDDAKAALDNIQQPRDELLAETAKYYARIGEVDRATKILEGLRVRLAGRLTNQNLSLIQLVESEIELRSGNSDESFSKIQSAAAYRWRYLYWPVQESLGYIALATNHCEVAARAYEDMLRRRGFAFYADRPDDWIMAHYGLARAHECSERPQSALVYYTEFSHLWANASPVAPALQDARARILTIKQMSTSAPQ